MLLKDQVVIVTGAGGNVGGAMARVFAESGARLALVDKSEDSLKAAQAGLPAATDCLLLAGMDLRNELDVERTARETLDRFGRIDGLANTVGTFRMGRIDGDALSQWSLLMDLNALSALLLSRVVGPAMAKQGYGRMLHIAAAGGLKGGAEMGPYSASKSALMRLVESVAEEYRGQGVTANCVLPTTIDTPQNRAAMPQADTSSWIAPEAIGRAAALLLSRDAAAITGAMIPVSGGR
jgi:NAD(P)-dependent dehydrogenase (short-subunit alcohol dehydrogenase family)